MVLPPPLHHAGAGADETANPLQRFLDSDPGIVLGGILHTLGALLFTAGIALYVYQARQVQHARNRGDAPTLRVLPLAHGLTLSGIVFNGLGGLMRLYQSDHPGLEQLGSSAWVQLLVLKHLFLILGVGAAVYLTYFTHGLATREDAPTSFVPHTSRISAVAFASFATILLATVLGAVAGNTPIPGVEPPAVMDEEGGDEHVGHAMTAHYYANWTGTLTGTPAQPDRQTRDWTLPENTSQVFVELGFGNAARTQANVELVDPTGKAAAPKRETGAGRVSLTLDRPMPGTWKIVVSSTQSFLEPYTVIARATTGPVPHIFERTYLVNPSPGAGGIFVETNLKMAPGNRINFTWRVLESSSQLDFNLHVHFGNNQVEYPIRGTWNSYTGNYTHVAGKGDGASLMWTNRNQAALRITVRIEGTFTFESEHVG